MGRVKRVVVAAALVAQALTACGAAVPGEPVPAAGFAAVPATGVADVRIATPRVLAGVDTCGLLQAADLTAAGGLDGAPERRTGTFPDSCVYPLAGGAEDDVALVAFHKPLDQVRRDQPDGHGETTSGHSTWVHCTVSDGYRTCVAAVAVRDDRSLVVALDKRDTPEAGLLGALQPLAEAALSRLPSA